jgi:hypothetical protein
MVAKVTYPCRKTNSFIYTGTVPTHIPKPTRITAGNKPKLIVEFIGCINSRRNAKRGAVRSCQTGDN